MVLNKKQAPESEQAFGEQILHEEGLQAQEEVQSVQQGSWAVEVPEEKPKPTRPKKRGWQTDYSEHPKFAKFKRGRG